MLKILKQILIQNKINNGVIYEMLHMIKAKKIIPHFSFMLQIKCLGESKIRIIYASICNKKRHRDNWGKLVYVSNDDKRYCHYCYYNH